MPQIIHMVASSTDEHTTTLDGSQEHYQAADPETKEAWISLNSFAAGLWRTGAVSWELFAVWQLNDALDLDDVVDDWKNTQLLAAAEWVLLAGDRFFQLASGPTNSHTFPVGTSSELSLSRWTSWTRKFGERGASEAVLAMNDAASGRFKASPYGN